MNKLNGLLKYFLLLFCDGASNAKSVVFKLGSAVLLGSVKQFSGIAKHIPKKKIKTTLLKKEEFCIKKIFRQLIFPNQT